VRVMDNWINLSLTVVSYLSRIWHLPQFVIVHLLELG
jgi:hypothetical protein